MSRIKSTPTVSDLLSRVIEPQNGELSKEFATFLVSRRFPERDQRRLKKLAEKQRSRTITADEVEEMDRYIKVADLLEVLKAKAFASLQDERHS